MRKIISSRRQKLWRTGFLFVAAITCCLYSPVANAMKETNPNLTETQEKVFKYFEKIKKPDPATKPGPKRHAPPIPVKKEITKPGPKRHAPPIPVKKEITKENKIINTTLYKDGNEARTLDLCMFFDPEGLEEGRVRRDRYLSAIPITDDFTNTIEAEEAIMVSRSVMIAFSLLSKKVATEQAKNIMNLLCANKWSIFQEKHNHFFILIPHSKYPEIKSLEDLKTIGLNSKILKKKLYYNEIISINNAQKKLDELIKDTPTHSTLSIPDKLEYLFLNKKTKDGKIINVRTLDVRIILSGHGLEATSITEYPEQTENMSIFEQIKKQQDENPLFDENYTEYNKDLIAQFLPTEYRKIRDIFNNIGCSIFLVSTCYGGETTFMNLTLNLQRTKPATLPGPLSSKNFIEIIIGIPGFEVLGEFEPENLSKFFIDINNFFEDQKQSIIELIKSKQNLDNKEVKYLSKNITEQQILSGGKIQIPGKANSFNLDPIIRREPGIKKSANFSKIVKDFICKSKYRLPPSENNMPRVRFPGDTQMEPLKEAFPDELIEPVKKKVKDILAKKNKDLKKYEAMLPGFISKRHAGTDLLKQTINRLKIEIYDIGEYLKQLDRK